MHGSLVFARLRQCVPPCNTYFHGPTRVHIPNSMSISSAVFAQLTAEGPVTMGRPFLLEIAPCHGKVCTLSNAWFLGSTQVHNPNGISIGSVVFAGGHDRDTPTDRPTEHTTPSVTIGGIMFVVLRCGLIIRRSVTL